MTQIKNVSQLTHLSTSFDNIQDEAKYRDELSKFINKSGNNEQTNYKIRKANIKEQKANKKKIKKALKSSLISVVHPICCGIDVHKEVIVACLRTTNTNGEKFEEIRTFSSFTDDLLQMAEWLQSNNCPIIAMESTGIYWRPVHNILEKNSNIILVNARHFKNVPGRKTDIEDSKWLSELLQHGLLKGSFIPSQEVRDWRELERTRSKIIKDIGDYKRRVHKVFETANIKIASVVSDLFGTTGTNLMLYLCDSNTITLEGVRRRAKGKLMKKTDELYRSIQGFFRDHHRFELLGFLDIINCLEIKAESITKRLQSLMTSHEDILKRLIAIPGVGIKSSQSILGELGYDLSSFANEKALCSWAGVAPGNNQSAGKRYNGKSPVLKHHLKEILIEVAWAGVKTKGSYYKDKYYRLKSRRGAKKAIVAIAHSILKAIYFIIKYGSEYKELGDQFLAKKNNKNKLSSLKRLAKSLGYQLQAV